MAYKLYQTINILELHTQFMVEGKRRDVAFMGGTRSPIRRGGTFGTSDVKLQFVMERHSGYGTKYVLIGTDEPKEVITETPIQVESEVNATTTAIMNGKMVSGIKSGQKAKAWLLDNIEEVTNSMLKNNAEVRATAAKFNIVFPDWLEL